MEVEYSRRTETGFSENNGNKNRTETGTGLNSWFRLRNRPRTSSRPLPLERSEPKNLRWEKTKRVTELSKRKS